MVVSLNGTDEQLEYDLCQEASSRIVHACCMSRGLDSAGNVSLYLYPPPPPPPWWEELDYEPFMWGGVLLGVLQLIRWCRNIFQETADMVAPVAHEEFGAFAGRYMPCARCGARLAVNVFTLPDGAEEPLCASCF